ncbi:MAG: glycosyltransferase family 39 protein [Lachnospiraceae bacterium]|nr:glycosyltransferase family 39 protein [Lachnospiraceae bacterium]
MKRIIINSCKILLVLLSLVGAIKMVFFGLLIDEEYAVVMSYRMVSGDEMFLNMWEPHQTSGFVCAIFIKLFLMILGSTEYLIVYLRIVGVLLQTAVSLFVYCTVRKMYDKEIAFWAGIMCFSLLPKWIQIPEFSNILLWSNLCTMMCFLRSTRENAKKEVWLVLGAIFYCVAILAYPTCLVLIPIYLYGIYTSVPNMPKKHLCLFLGTCMTIGVAYILYFLFNLGAKEFLFGLRQMMTDGEHDYTFLQRLATYGRELLNLLPTILLIIAVTIVLYAIIWCGVLKKKFCQEKLVFLLLLVFVAHVQQFFAWNSGQRYINEPLLFYYFTFGAGVVLAKKEDPLFIFGMLPAMGTIVAVLLITNTTISVTGTNLLPGIIAGGILVWEYVKEKKLAAGYKKYCVWMGIVTIGLLMFAKGCLICENEGVKENIFYVKQKALSGPAKGIYCRYMDGYQYNILAEVTEKYISKEDVVLCVGYHCIRYMMTDGEISTYSTISTPTYDERLLEYWEIFPERYPTIIIEEEGISHMKQVREFLTLSDPIAEGDGFRIYRVIK